MTPDKPYPPVYHCYGLSKWRLQRNGQLTHYRITGNLFAFPINKLHKYQCLEKTSITPHKNASQLYIWQRCCKSVKWYEISTFVEPELPHISSMEMDLSIVISTFAMLQFAMNDGGLLEKIWWMKLTQMLFSDWSFNYHSSMN